MWIFAIGKEANVLNMVCLEKQCLPMKQNVWIWTGLITSYHKDAELANKHAFSSFFLDLEGLVSL